MPPHYGMTCPSCFSQGAKSIAVRTIQKGSVISRQRRCPSCGVRWRTWELRREDYERRLREAREEGRAEERRYSPIP